MGILGTFGGGAFIEVSRLADLNVATANKILCIEAEVLPYTVVTAWIVTDVVRKEEHRNEYARHPG